MTKFQGRIYFLYPFFLSLANYFFNIFFPGFYKELSMGEDITFLFFYVFIFSGLIAFSVEKKNVLAQIFAFCGSLIILSLLILMSMNSIFAFVNILFKAIIFSTAIHLVCLFFYVFIFYFFEWIFEVDQKEELRKYTNRI